MVLVCEGAILVDGGEKRRVEGEGREEGIEEAGEDVGGGVVVCGFVKSILRFTFCDGRGSAVSVFAAGSMMIDVSCFTVAVGGVRSCPAR